MSRFRGVWAAPHVRALLLSSLVARLPYGMNALALVLFVHEQTGSFARAGIVSAASALFAGIGLPILGRVVDRVGHTRVLIVTAVVDVAALSGVIALGVADAPTGAMVAVAAVAGFFVPPVSPCLRGLWSEILPGEEHLRSALALDAILLETIFIGGPVLTAGLVAVASPAVALAVGAALMFSGTLAFAAAPVSRAWRGSERTGGWLGPLRSRGLRTLMISSALLGFPIGVLDVALPAFGVEQGSRSYGGVFIAAMAAGSLVGGLWYGARVHGGVVRMYVVLSALFPVGIFLLLLPSSVAAMLVAAPLAGMVWAPLTTAENELAGAVAPAGTVTEAYAWLITGVIGGLAVGTSIAGVVVDEAGWREAVLLGAVCAVAGALFAFARRRTLGPLAAPVS